MQKVFCLFVFVLAIATGNAAAQEPTWEFSVGLEKTAVSGADLHFGDIFTYFENTVDRPDKLRQDYGVKYEPLFARPESAKSLRYSAKFHKHGWTINGRGWNRDLKGAASGKAESAEFATSYYSVRVVGVRMFGHSLTPVDNVKEKSKLSAIPYHGETRLGAEKYDILLSHDSSLPFKVHYGLSWGRVKHTRSEGQSQHAYLDEAAINGNIFLLLYQPLWVQESLDNQISLESFSESFGKLWGPSFGVSGSIPLKKFEATWDATHSVMFGKFETLGTWIDIDDTTEIYRYTSSPQKITQETYLHGQSETNLLERKSIPVLELMGEIRYKVNPSIKVGVGLTSSSWFGVPMAPSVSIPGQWTGLNGSGWEPHSGSFTLRGISATGQLTF